MWVLALLVGVSFMLSFALAVGVAFVLYQFVYLPWKVMRKDLSQIAPKFLEYDQKFQALEGALEYKRKFEAMTDEEIAAIEMRVNARKSRR